LRGIHTDVRPTDRPGVMYLGSSWITIVIFVVAFGLRSVVRFVMPHRGSLSGAVGDGLLAFAISFIVASYVVIARKYREEVAGRLASPPAPPEV
jgi:purine-cytosine permease-like protein